MRIGIDIRPLQAETKHRGIGKSLEFFLKELAAINHDSVVFYLDSLYEEPAIVKLFPGATLIHFDSLPITRKKYIKSIANPWRPLQVNSKDIDVLLQYDVVMGVPDTVATTVIFHDLIPYLFRDAEKKAAITKSLRRTLKNRLAGAAYWQQYQRFLKRYKNAKTIIAISDASRNDYTAYLSPPPEQRIVTIPHGVDNSFFTKTPPKLSSTIAERITKPYFLFVGGIDYRKNIAGLLRDFLRVREQYDVQLVLAGKEFALQDQLNDLGWDRVFKQHKQFADDIIRPGFVSHDDLITLLSGAESFVFPSLYEGFGMPLLEAMAVGCPVITYGNSSLKEVVGSDGIIVPDCQPLDDAMKNILINPKKYKKMRARAKKRAEKFTWRSTATAIISELHRYEGANSEH